MLHWVPLVPLLNSTTSSSPSSWTICATCCWSNRTSPVSPFSTRMASPVPGTGTVTSHPSAISSQWWRPPGQPPDTIHLQISTMYTQITRNCSLFSRLTQPDGVSQHHAGKLPLRQHRGRPLCSSMCQPFLHAVAGCSHPGIHPLFGVQRVTYDRTLTSRRRHQTVILLGLDDNRFCRLI